MCEICDGKSEDEVRLSLAKKIDTYGWAVEAVEGDADFESWAYTIGLMEHFGHPELVITSLSAEDSCRILNVLGNHIREGRRFSAGEIALVGGIPVELVAVDPQQFEHGVFNIWFDNYRALEDVFQLSALQVVLPRWLFCECHGHHQPRLDQPEAVLGIPRLNRAQRRARRRPNRRGRH
jgi:hypothetical protein